MSNPYNYIYLADTNIKSKEILVYNYDETKIVWDCVAESDGRCIIPIWETGQYKIYVGSKSPDNEFKKGYIVPVSLQKNKVYTIEDFIVNPVILNELKKLSFGSTSDAQLISIANYLNDGVLKPSDLNWKVGDERVIKIPNKTYPGGFSNTSYTVSDSNPISYIFVILNIGGVYYYDANNTETGNGNECKYVLGMKNASVYSSGNSSSGWKDVWELCTGFLESSVLNTICKPYVEYTSIAYNHSNGGVAQRKFDSPTIQQVLGKGFNSLSDKYKPLSKIQFEYYKVKEHRIKYTSDTSTTKTSWSIFNSASDAGNHSQYSYYLKTDGETIDSVSGAGGYSIPSPICVI